MELTGERTVPGVWHENYWFRRHEIAYVAAAELCHGMVLEAGCGEGYGARRLRDTGAGVVGLDYDEATVAHARTTYPGVAFVCANLVALPFTEARFDVVVSLQTVEHLWDQPGFVNECARVLRPGGRLVLSTPNRLTFPPGNIFHAREVTAAELVALVEPICVVRSVLGVRHGPRIVQYERAHGDLVKAQLAVPPNEWPDHLATFIRDLRADDFTLSPDDIDASLDLYLVAEAP